MKEEVSLLEGYGAVLCQRSMRLGTVYGDMNVRATGLSGVERRTFQVGMRWSGGRGEVVVDDMSLYTTVVPVCRVDGHSQSTDDSLTHVVTCRRSL